MDGRFDRLTQFGEPWDEEPPTDQWYARTYSPPALDRLTHLVLVDGRMVDLWTEAVHGTRWQHFADRFDHERRPPPMPEPVLPAYDVALEWLRALVGGHAHLAALDVVPLEEHGRPSLDGLPLPARTLLETILRVVDRLEDVFTDPELGTALLNALWLVRDREPVQLSASRSPEHLVAGLVHAVGKANGAFSPQGPHTQREVAEVLGLRGSLAGRAYGVEPVLSGFRRSAPRPARLPDLLVIGEPTLLTSATRRDVIRWRNQAISAREEAVPP